MTPSTPLREQVRDTARKLAYPFLPPLARRRLDARAARLPLFALTKSALEQLMRASHFADFHISVHNCDSPLWDGEHLECLAAKP